MFPIVRKAVKFFDYNFARFDSGPCRNYHFQAVTPIKMDLHTFIELKIRGSWALYSHRVQEPRSSELMRAAFDPKDDSPKGAMVPDKIVFPGDLSPMVDLFLSDSMMGNPGAFLVSCIDKAGMAQMRTFCNKYITHSSWEWDNSEPTEKLFGTIFGQSIACPFEHPEDFLDSAPFPEDARMIFFILP